VTAGFGTNKSNYQQAKSTKFKDRLIDEMSQVAPPKKPSLPNYITEKALKRA
jgi:hypothetical protein